MEHIEIALDWAATGGFIVGAMATFSDMTAATGLFAFSAAASALLILRRLPKPT